MIRRLKRGLFNSAFRLGTVASRKSVRVNPTIDAGKTLALLCHLVFAGDTTTCFDVADFRLPAFVHLLKYS
jgi:hypothetical protein